MGALFTLQNNPIIDIYEIKINDFEGYFCFHGSKNLEKDIVFKGKTYIYLPCELSNLDYSSEQKQNRPTLKIANTNNFITNIIKDRNDLLMKRFYRKKIFAKDLDLENFDKENNPLGAELFTSFISVDAFVIQKKNYENKDEVEFSLSNIIDIEGQTCPSRKVYNDSCQWIYRGFGCGYGKRNNRGKTIKTYSSVFLSLENVYNRAESGFGASNILAYFRGDDGLTTNGTVKENVLYRYNQDDAGAVIEKESEEFQKVTEWTYKSGPSLSSNPLTLTAGQSFVNNGRNYGGGLKKIVNSNGNIGVLLKACAGQNYGFTSADSIEIPIDIFASGNQDLTFIYVYEFANKLLQAGWWPKPWPSGGQQYGSLMDKSGQNKIGDIPNYNLGLQFGNSNQFSQLDTSIRNGKDIGFPRMISFRNSTSNIYSLYKNGNYLKLNASTNNPTLTSTRFGFNLNAFVTSEIIIYECIVLNTALKDEDLRAVHSYLASKYNINIPNIMRNETTAQSIDFFNGYGYDLGVPMADENNKMFLANQDSDFKFYENYNFPNLVYRGNWDRKKTYKQGDVVKIDSDMNCDFNEEYINKNSDAPSSFFVCVNPKNGISIGEYPYNYTEVWREDKCSKTLNGCKLRFNNPLPFGGFPGTVPYEYKFPSGS